MEVVITARHFKPTARLRELVEEKFGRFARYAARRIPELHVTLTAEKHLFRVEAVLGAVRISHESDDLMISIERASDRMKEKLRKDHEKRREHKGRMGLKDAGNGRVTTRRVVAEPRVRREQHETSEIALVEATTKLQKSDRDFLVFISRETGRVNVLYKRKDGKLGLIEPEPVES